MESNLKIKNVISIFLGIGFSILTLEFLTRILPATDSFALETPIECSDINKLNLNCFHRRQRNISGRFTKGKFPPFEINAIKSANDIGQFSNVDIKDFAKYENNSQIIRIISIGDSQVESLQVDNSDSFHGLFNNKFINIKRKGNLYDYSFISTAIGSSGMAFPNYIQYLKYVSKITDLDSDYVILSIQPNDFDESFEKYGIKGRRAGRGQFFFDSSGKIFFKDFPKENYSEKMISFLLKNSYLIRYLTYNTSILQNIKHSKIYCLFNSSLAQCRSDVFNHAANVIEESFESNPERYKIGFNASKIFLNKLSDLRPNDITKKNTILLIDADRGYIQGKYKSKGEYFNAQRNYLIKEAKKMGFTVIDLEPEFINKFNAGFSLNSKVDGHWNESAHKIVNQHLFKKMEKLIEDKI